MRLKQLIKILDNPRLYCGIKDAEIKGISCNSKEVRPGFIFVAIKGNKEDGHKFIKEAMHSGAAAVVTQGHHQAAEANSGVCRIEVADTRKALAALANEFYAKPSEKIKVVGITGTNGKTTISYLIEAVLKEAHFNPAVIGTINYRSKGKVVTAKNTTPGSLETQSMLSEALKEGIKYAIMEVSSHALNQERVAGINFHSAIFTNLTQDHLDYHSTLENYFQAKTLLFKNLKTHSFCVINNDDAYGRKLKKLTPAEVLTYGIDSKADLVAKDIRLGMAQTEFIAEARSFSADFRTRLIGRHNVYNLLACICWAQREGIRLPVIKSAIAKFSFVPGRMEKIDSAADFSVFVDYAHTEDALRNVLGFLRQISPARIIVVFGCGGERDKTKRPKMGRLVTEMADYAFITNDNPRSENPEEIVSGICSGISKNNYKVIFDRREAIKQALASARARDIVLIAGKGHEDYQVLKDKSVHFDDREVARECLAALKF